MTNPVRPDSERPKVVSILYANYLLTTILSSDDLLTIHPYSAYKAHGLESYEASKVDSSRCTEYVRFKRSNYDILGAISCGIDSIEELERVEREEAEALAALDAQTNPPLSSATPPLLDNNFVLS
ncbi:hypothetical protein C8A01DRAFT_48764 [Parachaetomium inaequale]|uniref:Uncharacterized protein n=1 Tax=Parachaetomium inaequale TaxID=2588326 RepID=A0AAN6SPL3_9PEZI|nr:hypothetical protein C8A01DRAFT_48764 [Parachaetomium inaequale]